MKCFVNCFIKRCFLYALSFSFLVLFTCCTGLPKDITPPFVYLSDDSIFYLLPLDECGPQIEGLQQMQGNYNDKKFSFNVYVTSDKTQLCLELLSSMGNSFGSLDYNGKKVSVNSIFFPSALKAEYIIADFQICFYDSLAIQNALSQSGLKLICEIESENNKTTKIMEGDTCIIQIQRQKGKIIYQNILRGYTYTLEGEF